jgi:hypothetical protein
MGNDEKPAGYFLYLLVTVDLGTKAVHDNTSWDKNDNQG